MASTIVDYCCGISLQKTDRIKTRKLILSVSLFVNLGLLAIFKYFNFFAENLLSFGNAMGWHFDKITLDIVLPVGISFYTFQTLSYTIDIYYKKLPPERNFLNFALFVAFFPQLVAGPIERAKNLLPQIQATRSIKRNDVKSGLWLILFGYYLKIFVADNLAGIVDYIFENYQTITGLEALIGIYGFAFQIFGDFAGYSSIAIGLSRMMGFKLMTNFRLPYFVTNPQEFWQNWHISLSTWLKDYLYIPLGGNRNGDFALYRNLFLTMLLGGLWHGASWTFVIWGIYHGIILIFHRIIRRIINTNGTRQHQLIRYSKIFIMFQITCFGWLLFRSETLSQVKYFLHAIVNGIFCVSDLALYSAASLIFYTLFLFILNLAQYKLNSANSIQVFSTPIKFMTILIIFYSIQFWGAHGAKQFIYFQF